MKTVLLPSSLQNNTVATGTFQKARIFAENVVQNQQNAARNRFKGKWLCVNLILLMTIMLGFSQRALGQCNTPNTNQWPTNAVSAGTGASVQISNQIYEGDYSRITGIISGAQYKFTISQTSDIITVRVGSSNGTILGYGTGSTIVTTTATSDLYVHWNTSSCGTNNNNRTGTVQAIPLITGLGTPSGCPGSTITITGNNFSGVTATNVKIGGTSVSSITSVTSTQIVAVIAAGTTSGTVNVANAAGSSTSASSFINSLPTVITGQPVAPAAICSGNGTQTMNVTATGTNLTYNWRKGTTALVDGLVISGQGTPTLSLASPSAADAGSYNVVVTGDCGAVTSNSITVTIHPTPISSVTGQTNITCNALSNGTITVSASNGTSPYQFSVTEGASWQAATNGNTSLFTGLIPNYAYKIKVKDNNGCISK